MSNNYQSGSIDLILDRMWSSNLYECDKDSEVILTDIFQFQDLDSDISIDETEYD